MGLSAFQSLATRNELFRMPIFLTLTFLTKICINWYVTSTFAAQPFVFEHIHIQTQNGLDEHFISDWPGIMNTSFL